MRVRLGKYAVLLWWWLAVIDGWGGVLPAGANGPGAGRPAAAIVDDIAISGNRRTKEFIIRREMDLAVGDTVRLGELPERLRANERRLFNTQLFGSVSVQADSSRLPLVAVRVVVRENWYVWAAPYARLNDRNLNEWADRGRELGRLNYGLFLDHENLFGRHQKLELIAETGFTDRFTLRYNVPYLDRRGVYGLFSEIRYQSLSNLAYNTQGNQLAFVYRDAVLQTQLETHFRLRRRQGFYVFHYAELEYHRTEVSADLRELNPYYLGRGGAAQQQVTSLGYTFRYDRRDNVNFPLQGRALIADVRRLGVLPTDDFRSWQLRLAVGDYYPLGGKWYANYLLKGQLLTTPDVPYSLLRGIGYEEDVLRGYDLYVVNGSAYGMGRLNMKRELLRRTLPLRFVPWRQFNTLPLNLYFTGFTDWGGVYNRYPDRLDNPLANRVLRSAGVGLEINTWYNTVVRLNLSRNALQQTHFFVNLQKDLWTRWN
jgi:outer membrane protein assembly factor BamA